MSHEGHHPSTHGAHPAVLSLLPFTSTGQGADVGCQVFLTQKQGDTLDHVERTAGPVRQVVEQNLFNRCNPEAFDGTSGFRGSMASDGLQPTCDHLQPPV